MSLPSKRGLCWPTDNKDPVHSFTKPGSKISWLYNWSPTPTPDSASLKWIAMQWNHADIENLGQKLKSTNTSVVLGFNEPELSSQSNISASVAAEKWIAHIEPLRKQGVRVGSPGISSAPDGVAWLKDFLQRIRASGASDVDFYCFHWYGETLGQFYDYIWSVYYQLGADRKVWITEFASTNWSVEKPLERAHVEAFAKESVKYLDGLEWVEAYAWFGAMRDCGTVGKWARMLDDDGQLTDLGRCYRDE